MTYDDNDDDEKIENSHAAFWGDNEQDHPDAWWDEGIATGVSDVVEHVSMIVIIFLLTIKWVGSTSRSLVTQVNENKRVFTSLRGPTPFFYQF